jgi:mRNA interferase MazF
MYTKNFDEWNQKKKEIDRLLPVSLQHEEKFFYEREIWWAHVGENIGFEMCGKGKLSTRPVVIIKKFSADSAFVIPLSTKVKHNKYVVSLGLVSGKESCANVTQLRLIDMRRCTEKITMCNKASFEMMRKKLREFFS